jgi:hypothetical protein
MPAIAGIAPGPRSNAFLGSRSNNVGVEQCFLGVEQKNEFFAKNKKKCS